MHTENAPRASILADMQGEHANSLSATALKRDHDSLDGDLTDPDKNGNDLHNEVKRLRRKVQEKDRCLEHLERIVADLQQAIRQLPVPDHDPQATQAIRTPAP